MANTTMGGGCCQAHHIEQRSASDPNHVGMAIDVVSIDMRMNVREMKVGIFGALAARYVFAACVRRFGRLALLAASIRAWSWPRRAYFAVKDYKTCG